MCFCDGGSASDYRMGFVSEYQTLMLAWTFASEEPSLILALAFASEEPTLILA